MRKVILLGFIMFCGVCFGQEEKYDVKDFFKRGLNAILENNSTDKKQYSCYFKGNELYVNCEAVIHLSYSELMENEVDINNLSKEMAYRTADIFKAAISEDYVQTFNSRFINIKFSILTNDFKNIDYDYFFDVNKFIKIVPYFNKRDFLEILK